MYWTDHNSGRIEKASMDGSFRTTLHSSGLYNVIGLTLDYQNQTLYWMERRCYGRIERSSVNGTNRETILSSGLCYPWALSYYAETLYLTDRNSRRIRSINVTQPITINTIVPSLSYYPYDIKVIAEEQQQIGRLLFYVHESRCKAYHSLVCS